MAKNKQNTKDKSRDYTPTTIKRLFMFSGIECAAPDCNNLLIARDEISIISKICHIEAASKGGARYNPDMIDDDRRAHENLILLCDECHTIIDSKENETKYPREMLWKWKREHEKKVMARTEAFSELKKHPSVVASVINIIGASDFFNDENDNQTESFNPGDKISHNNLVDYKPFIHEYKSFQGKIQKVYSQIEAEGSLKSSILLQNIKRIYIKIKQNYVTNSGNEIEDIRKNADDIFEDVKNELWKIVENSSNFQDDISIEAIESGLLIVMTDAFIKCKILEEPPK